MKITDVLTEMDVPGYDSWKTHNPAWDEDDPEFDNDMVELVDKFKETGSLHPEDIASMMDDAYEAGVVVDVDSSYDDLFGPYKQNPQRGEKINNSLEDYFGERMDTIVLGKDAMSRIVNMDTNKEKLTAIKREGFSEALLRSDADDLKRFVELISDNLEQFDRERSSRDDYDPSDDDRSYDY